MSGALVELVAKGAQDAYLTGDPQVSFFHQAYRRHTNFAQKTVLVNYTGTAGPTQQISMKLLNKGDMLGYIWMDMSPFNTAPTGLTSNVGMLVGNGIDSPTFFELYIGGQLIDRQDAYYMVQYWQKFLSDSSAKGNAFKGPVTTSAISTVMSTQWLPLHFFFCDSCYLPLVALQYHEVEIRVTFGANYVAAATPPNFYANYIVLDTAERAVIVDKECDLLIEQVQRITASSNSKFDLSFLNHPVKCLFWGESNVNISSSIFQTQQCQIYLNGTELFGSEMPDIFFSSISSYYNSEYSSTLQGAQTNTGAVQAVGGNYKMYSFALKATKHQPCGTCNFSRLDNASITFTAPTVVPANFFLYAVNFNILRIKNGMSGLAFSS
jgi:hypothetical protein